MLRAHEIFAGVRSQIENGANAASGPEKRPVGAFNQACVKFGAVSTAGTQKLYSVVSAPAVILKTVA